MTTHIYDKQSDVAQFAEIAAARADTQKDALGFLPRSVYAEGAAQGKLFIATVGDGRSESYAGHILFGGRFPHLKIFQLFVDPSSRRHRIGQSLVEKLVDFAEKQSYLSVSARVAADLPANAFWEHLGFVSVRVESGGITTGRKINVRVRELDTPTLFSELDDTPSGISHTTPEVPVFLIDVNVLLDIVKDRERAGAAKRIFTASMCGLLKLFVAEEFVHELNRAAKQPQADPALGLALLLPRFPSAPDETFDHLKDDLANLIFPTRKKVQDLKNRELSDLLHLATSIYHSAVGFVTSDDAILRKRQELRTKYLIDVLGPAELAELYIPNQWNATDVNSVDVSGAPLHMKDMTEFQRKPIETFLRSCTWTSQQISNALAPGHSASPRHRIVAYHAEEIVAFASWNAPHPHNSQCEVWLAVAAMHHMGELVSDVLVEHVARDISASRPACAVLRGQTKSRNFRSIMVSRGFVSVGPKINSSHFEKLCVGGVLSPLNWSARVGALSQAIGLAMPEKPPEYHGTTTMIDYSRRSGASERLPILAFEGRFGPTILCLPGRPVVIVPIKRNFADQLLGTAIQGSLLPRNEASMWQERLYISSPRILATLCAGSVIFFYESRGTQNGRGAIVAVAQVVRTAIRKKTSLNLQMTRRGVLSPEEIEGMAVGMDTALIYFGQLMPMRNPVPMARLRELRCMDGANFVTARRITETAACAIIEEGRPHARL